MEEQLELTFLRQAVERRFGSVPDTTAAFVRLAEEMDDKVSASTLKRIWGYVGMKVEPRKATLDALSEYVGFRDFKAFSEELRTTQLSSSGYFNSSRIDAATLLQGDTISLGWRPDRLVTLIYLGDYRFKVKASENAKLQVGDEFEAHTIVKGFPLIITKIFRNGETTPSYIAGRDGGIVFITMG